MYDLSGIYFNPVSSSTKNISNFSLGDLDKRFLKLSGGTISNNLIVANSLDVQNSLTLPIGNVENIITSLSNQQNSNTNNISANTTAISEINSQISTIETQL